MASGQRVLVVDDLTQTAEVLRAVLEPRGVCVEQAPAGAHRSQIGKPLDRSARVSVVVVDEETAAVRGGLRHEWHDTPTVFIGTVSRPAGYERTAAIGAGVPTRYLSKPFQYADLVRVIETLIAERAA